MQMIEEQKRAAEEQASKEILRRFIALSGKPCLLCPQRNMTGFRFPTASMNQAIAEKVPGSRCSTNSEEKMWKAAMPEDKPQREFFDFPGPLYKAAISPASCTVRVGESRNFRAMARDRNRRLVEENLSFEWTITDGPGQLSENQYGDCELSRSRMNPALRNERECPTGRNGVRGRSSGYGNG